MKPLSKIRILANIPNVTDGTSYYRAGGPIAELVRSNPDFEFTFNPQTYDWFVLKFTDLIFLQRPLTEQHLQIVEMARKNCIPIWVDYDDDLFSVPKYNPAHRIYANPKTQQNIARILARADVVTVSTRQLARKYEKLNPNIRVIPNAFDDLKVNARPAIERKRKIINWRGSPTHQKDVAVYGHHMLNLCKEFPAWKWNFIGDSFWGLTEAMPKKNISECPPVDPMEYWHLLGQLQPALQIVPLEDNEFNRSKSNIAWLEAAYSGCGSLVPDWEEWQVPGTVRYSSVDDYYAKLKGMLGGEWDLEKLGHEAWQGVWENYRLSQINPMRANLVYELMEKGRKPFESERLVDFSQDQLVPCSETSTKEASS